MIELHGWVTIRETYEAKFDEEDNVDVVIENINKEIQKLLWFKPCIKVQNGTYFLEFTLFSNRKSAESQEIFNLYNRIGELAAGSYGLIYLSPIVPIIEDEEI